MFKFLILAGLGLLLVSCQGQDAPGRPSDNSPVSFALIALSDGTVGCGDSTVLVTREIPEDSSNFESERIQLALEALFAVEGQNYGESGLYNALYQSDLTVESVDWVQSNDDPKEITVALTGSIASGGTCDDPRIVAQIEETVKGNASAEATITITLNGKDLATYFDMSGQ